MLQAVAERVAQEDNPQSLVSEMEQSGSTQVTLQSVVARILDREQQKLKILDFDDDTLFERLYLPSEQLDRLVSHRHDSPDPAMPQMSQADLETYSNAAGELGWYTPIPWWWFSGDFVRCL